MNYTDELGLKLPELDEAFDLENHWNYNTQKIDAFAATTNTAVGTLESGLASAQSQIAALQGGVHLKGSVNYYADLPADPDDGDAYTVLYFGTSGQEPAGIEYAWVDSSQSWIPIGVDPAAFAKPADISAAIAALDVTETGGTGQYISAISEENGKIEATPITFDKALSSSSTNNNAPTSKTVFDDQQRQEVEIGAVANAGAKNFCPKETETSTGSGFTSDVPVNIPAGTYILSFTGTLAYTASLSLYRALPHSGNSLANVNISATTGAQSVEFTISETAKYIAFYHNGSGNSLTNIMIRPASITDPTFQPYALPNPTLTTAAIKAVDEGAKNLADMSKTSFTMVSKDGVQVSLSGDTLTSVGTGGTSTNNFFNIYYQQNTLLIPAGTWVASLHGTGTENFRIEEFDDINGTALKGEFGEPFTFTIPENATLSYLRITSKPSTNCAGTFKLMICTTSDWNVSHKFVPYCPTNRELYEMIKALQNNS